MNTILVFPDVHRPYHDKKSWELVLRVGEDLKPNKVVVIGDFGDFAQASAYLKDPRVVLPFDNEVDDVNQGLNEITNLGAKKHYFFEGNHEVRVEKRILQQMPEMVNHVPSAYALLKMHQRRKWEWIPYKQYKQIGKMSFAHEVGHCGKTAVRLSAQAFGDNLIIGHGHRAGIEYFGNIHDGTRVCSMIGWLGDRDAIHYMHRSQTKDWQLGFCVVYQDKEGLSWVNFVPIIKNKCIFEGKEYSVK